MLAGRRFFNVGIVFSWFLDLEAMGEKLEGLLQVYIQNIDYGRAGE
jgi:hypothetical protein